MKRWHVRDPKDLAVDLDVSEAVLRQVLLFQTEKREVRQIAEDRLEPSMLRHDLAHSRIFKFVDIERQHRDVLRSAGRGDRVQNRLREIFAEVNAIFFE